MATSTKNLTLLKSLYWLILGLGHLYVCYLLFTNNRAITGILWFILGAMLIYIMYPVYFPPGDPGAHWPPYISACPDYLTLLAPNACVDYAGLNSPLLKKSDPAYPPAVTDSTRVFNAAGTPAQKAARAQQYGLSWDGIA
jgi:hypothetical protein